jgi:hypothetical protein
VGLWSPWRRFSESLLREVQALHVQLRDEREENRKLTETLTELTLWQQSQIPLRRQPTGADQANPPVAGPPPSSDSEKRIFPRSAPPRPPGLAVPYLRGRAIAKPAVSVSGSVPKEAVGE